MYPFRLAFSVLTLFLFLSSVTALEIPLKTDFTENIKLNKPFEEAGYKGCILIYDLNKGEYITNDPKRCSVRFSPASTFKIPNSLIGLETGVIKDENFVIKWDGKERMLKIWNKDHDLKLALKNSTVWYYQELARRVGEERIKKHIDALSYGNMDISDGIDKFWLTGSLKISALEQVEFLKDLYNEKLPFSKRSMDIVRKIMIVNKTKDYTFRAKTGAGDKAGWFIGYLEKNGNVYFFATNIDHDGSYSPKFQKARIDITMSSLKLLGLL